MGLFIFTSEIDEEEKLVLEAVRKEIGVENISFQEMKQLFLAETFNDIKKNLETSEPAVISGDFKDVKKNSVLLDASLNVTGVAKNTSGQMMFYTPAGTITVIDER